MANTKTSTRHCCQLQPSPNFHPFNTVSGSDAPWAPPLKPLLLLLLLLFRTKIFRFSFKKAICLHHSCWKIMNCNETTEDYPTHSFNHNRNYETPKFVTILVERMRSRKPVENCQKRIIAQ